MTCGTEYAYEDDLLKSIETPTTTYNFTYGDFSLRTGVSIGDPSVGYRTLCYVQLSRKGKEMLGWLSRDGNHINVSLKGIITHK